MGFMMVYMFSLELVESGGRMQEGVREAPKHTPCHAPLRPYYLRGWA